MIDLQHLQLTAPAVCLDLEATGVRPQEDRIVQIGLILLDVGAEPVEKVRLVSPGIPIPSESTQIHGISDTDVAGAPTFAAIARSLQAMLSGRAILGFGCQRYDVELLAAEFARCGIEWEPDGAVVDACQLFHHFNPRDLSAAVRTYLDRDHDDAHDALSDARAALEVLQAQIVAHELPHDLAALEAVTADPLWIDRAGKLTRCSDPDCSEIHLNFGAHQGKTLSHMARTKSSYLDWMLKGDFSRQVKQHVRDAMVPPSMRSAAPRTGQMVIDEAVMTAEELMGTEVDMERGL